jgi:acetyl-CoA acetyltransferase
MTDTKLLRRLRGATAIVGVGASRFTRQVERTNEALAAESILACLTDAGRAVSDVDGLIVCMGWPTGVNYDRVAEHIGLDVSMVYESWAHGRFTNPSLHLAAMAITSGMASTVLCVAVAGFAKKKVLGGPGSTEEYRPAGGPHGEAPHVGLTAPMSGAATSMAKYFARYGGTSADLAAFAVHQRAHAALNPAAIMRSPMTVDDYLTAPYVIEPLRRFDCSLVSDGAVSVLLTSADVAADTVADPVYLLGMQSMHASRNDHSFALPGLGIFSQDEYTYTPDTTSLDMAGAGHDDVDVLGVYDAFSVQTLATLERFGFCAPGEGLDWVRDGRIGLGGALPVNTAGGHLSEAHVGGWGQVVELVRQLRGECGERQVPDVRIGMYAHSLGDATVLSTRRN